MIHDHEAELTALLALVHEAGDLLLANLGAAGHAEAIEVLYDPDGDFLPMIRSFSGIFSSIVTGIIAGIAFILGAGMIWFIYGNKILGR